MVRYGDGRGDLMYVEEFTALLDEWAETFDSTPQVRALEECHAVIVKGMADGFAAARSPEGVAWQATQEVVNPNPILNRSGALLAAATGGAGHIYRNDGVAMETGVMKAVSGSLAGAGVHQYGAVIKAKAGKYLHYFLNGQWRQSKQVTIPARPYVGASPAVVNDCEQIITESVRETVFKGH